MDGVCRLKPGFRRRRSKAGTGRAVRFQSKAVVFEFERQLFGGGGVPDGGNGGGGGVIIGGMYVGIGGGGGGQARVYDGSGDG